MLIYVTSTLIENKYVVVLNYYLQRGNDPKYGAYVNKYLCLASSFDHGGECNKWYIARSVQRSMLGPSVNTSRVNPD